MCENEVWSQVVQELSQHHSAAADRGGQQALPAEAEDEDPEAEVEVSTEERAEIEAKMKHIHCSTGHGSIESLRRALQSRGVSQKVLQVARGWSCPTCQEWKQKNPRRQATLEGLPKKWERIQMDVGTWTHPISRRRVQFLMMIDEGSRFRLGHILLEHPSRTGSWKEVREGYEKTWLMMLGKPHTVRADPAGCLRSEEAGRYFEEQNTVLDLVPAEAHWQIGVVEEAIRTTKGMLTQLATDFPEKPTEELFRHAIQAANKRDFQAGYSPYQHALGKAPDEWGRLLGGGASPLVASWEEDFAEDARLRGQAESAFVQETTRRGWRERSNMAGASTASSSRETWCTIGGARWPDRERQFPSEVAGFLDQLEFLLQKPDKRMESFGQPALYGYTREDDSSGHRQSKCGSPPTRNSSLRS